MLKEAIAEFRKSQELSGINKWGSSLLVHGYAVSGKRDEAKRISADIGKRSTTDFFWTNYFEAVVSAGLDEKEEAITYLEKAYYEHSLGPAWLRFDPRLDNLPSEPRFRDLLQRTGLGSSTSGKLLFRIIQFDRVHPAQYHTLAAHDAFAVFGGVENVERAWDHGR